MSRRLTNLGFVGATAFGAVLALGASCDDRALRRPARTPTTLTPPGREPPTLRLYYLVDLDGYLEPCGCTTRPLGGIDRLAHLLERERSQAPRSLLVAAGNTFFEHPQVEDRMVHQERERALALGQILDALGLSAFAPGPSDWALGADTWRALTEHLRARPLVANGTAAPGVYLHEVDGVKVGVIGVSELAPTEGATATGAPETSDPVEGARRAVAQARSQGARVTVVLASTSRRTARAIASGAGADFVVAAREASLTPPPPERVGGAYVVTATSQGRGVGVIDLHLVGSGPFEDASERTRDAERTRLDARIADLRARIDRWASDPSVERSAVELQRRRLAELGRQRAALEGARPAPRGRWFSASVLEVTTELQRAPAVERVIGSYTRAVNEHNRVTYADLRAPAAPPGQARFVGDEVCRDCHEEAWQMWSRTRHARAYHTLEAVSKNYNLSCVGCHITGYRQPGGSEVVQHEGLRDVQCEACHGPGSLHADARTDPRRRETIRRQVPGTWCASQCHTPEHSDSFNYEEYLPRILGPGHGEPLDGGVDGGARDGSVRDARARRDGATRD